MLTHILSFLFYGNLCFIVGQALRKGHSQRTSPNKSFNRIFMKCKLLFLSCFALLCLLVVATSRALRSTFAFDSHACFMKFKKLPLCRDMVLVIRDIIFAVDYFIEFYNSVFLRTISISLFLLSWWSFPFIKNNAANRTDNWYISSSDFILRSI